MANKLIKGSNFKRYKVHNQSRVNLGPNYKLGLKLRRKKWSFLRFNNEFKFFPRFRSTKLKFFFKNLLNIRRVLSSQNCRLNSNSLKKIFLKARRGHPRYLNFLNILESRLDICLYRLGLFKSPSQVRQYLAHGNVYLNGSLINKPNILLKKNDLVQLNFSNISLSIRQKERLISIENNHLEFSLTTFSFVYLGFFSKENLPYLNKEYVSFLNYLYRT
jgi:ribosomal protein S4